MECPNIDNLRFSQTSKETIKAIQRKKELGDLLIRFLGYGTWVNIFAGNGMLEATYSFHSTDFEQLAKTMVTVPEIVRASIEKEAGMAALNVSDAKEKKFWIAIFRGCSIR